MVTVIQLAQDHSSRFNGKITDSDSTPKNYLKVQADTWKMAGLGYSTRSSLVTLLLVLPDLLVILAMS
jgi:hypothetical protein